MRPSSKRCRDIQPQLEALLPSVRRFAVGDYGIALGGAHAKQMADEESDLDVYIFARTVLSPAERGQLIARISPEITDVVCWGDGEPFVQAGTDFLYGNRKVECWLRNSDCIDRTIQECQQGLVKRDLVTWTTTGFYNHCCLSDLNVMVAIDDPVGMLAAWKKAIGEYPPRLREAILHQHLQAAQFWPGNFHYRSAVERRDTIYTSGIVQQVVHNLIQVLFALNRTYFPGDKKLEASLKHLARQPDGLAGRVHDLLFPPRPVSVEVLRDQREALRSLLGDVEALVEGER